MRGAENLGIMARLVDADKAYAASILIKKWHWWLMDRRPPYLEQYAKNVLRECRDFRPDVLIATGLAPLSETVLEKINRLGIHAVNYLTDDPWNRKQRSHWFFKTLPLYKNVFNVRRSNIADLKKAGCRNVHYLPFGYDPGLHYPEKPAGEEEMRKYQADILFVGGADGDRLLFIRALIRKGFRVALYGNYWNRYVETMRYARGFADPRQLRLATGCAKISLCLVRRSNRDDNVMRSYEIPAAGGCMLAEDTAQHRAVFGDEGESVYYFSNELQMVQKASYLLTHENARKILRQNAYNKITQKNNTYADRLKEMLMITASSTEKNHDAS